MRQFRLHAVVARLILFGLMIAHSVCMADSTGTQREPEAATTRSTATSGSASVGSPAAGSPTPSSPITTSSGPEPGTTTTAPSSAAAPVARSTNTEINEPLPRTEIQGITAPRSTPSPQEHQAKPNFSGPKLLSAMPAVPETNQSADRLVREYEWLLSSKNIEQAKQAQQLLEPWGLKIKRRQGLAKLGLVISVYTLPDEADAYALFEQVYEKHPELQLEFNQHYPLLSSPDIKNYGHKNYGQALTALPVNGCSHFTGSIAVMDSKVNANLAQFTGLNLTLLDLSFLKKEKPSDHGTAMIDLLSHLLPNSSLLAINVYKDLNNKLETRTDWLLEGFEAVLTQQPLPMVLNMSFGGNSSVLVKHALDTLARHKIRLVAAAGNGGPEAEAVYPAAYPNVIAVSAVDIESRLWQQTNIGSYLSYAAPGVDLWLSNAQGKKRYMSGTSFAAPWVSAAAALASEEQWQQPESLTKDLGPRGFDPHFGHGLIQFSTLCGG